MLSSLASFHPPLSQRRYSSPLSQRHGTRHKPNTGSQSSQRYLRHSPPHTAVYRCALLEHHVYTFWVPGHGCCCCSPEARGLAKRRKDVSRLPRKGRKEKARGGLFTLWRTGKRNTSKRCCSGSMVKAQRLEQILSTGIPKLGMLRMSIG